MAEKQYIEREAVMKIIDNYGCAHGGVLGSHSGAVDVVGDVIYKLPAADVTPVKHAKKPCDAVRRNNMLQLRRSSRRSAENCQRV